MKNVTEDNKLLQELDFFFQDDLNLYVNFKNSIAAAYTMKLTSDAERDFLQHNTQRYFMYTPRAAYSATFLNYCHLASTPDTPYLLIRKDGRLSSVFCLSGNGVITQRKHIYYLSDMADIYHSFESELQRIKPKPNALPPMLSVAKEAVAV